MQRIAVVIPDPLVRRLTAQVLARCGLEPVEAGSFGAAVLALAGDPPEIGLVDEQLAPRLGAVVTRVRWIALGRVHERASLTAAGACCVIDKPFGAEDLLRAVRWVTEVYREQDVAA
jgi:DNA-binding response OmpR family regulator